MASWFSAAKNMEGMLTRSEVSQFQFNRAFYRSTTLKYHPQGSPTKMVNLLVIPQAVEISQEDEEEFYLPDAGTLSVACFCLNSLLGLWKVLVTIKKESVDDWMAMNYQSILYQGGRYRIDSCTQKKRQKLFYARIGDVLAAKPACFLIRLNHAAMCYQKSDDLENDVDVVRIWKKKNASNWTFWKLGSIRIMAANSRFNYNDGTKKLVSAHGIRIGRISDDSVKLLQDLMNCLWQPGTSPRPYWKNVTEDKALFYTTFPHAHNVISGLDLQFSQAGGGYRATRSLAAMLTHKRRYIEKADMDIKKVILKLLNEKRDGGTMITKVAYQPSFLVSAVHKPQHPHFNFKGSDLKNQNFWIGFLPITEYGQFLQIWKYQENIKEEQKGEIIFIPKGHMVMMRGTSLHGDGFRAETTSGNAGAHARLHFCIYPEVESCQIDVHGNEYMDPSRKAKVPLSRYYKNSDLLGGVAEGGDWCDSMNWNFFQGECPIDEETGLEQKVKVSRPAMRKRVREN